MNNVKRTAILLLSCPDRVGLVSRISHFIFERGGNILDLDEHVDPEEKDFSIRVAWDMTDFSISPSELKEAVNPLAKEFNALGLRPGDMVSIFSALSKCGAINADIIIQ